MKAMLTCEVVAERIGCKPQAVRRLMSEGRLPGAKIAGQWRVDPDVLEAFLSQAQKSAPEPKVTIPVGVPLDTANPFA